MKEAIQNRQMKIQELLNDTSNLQTKLNIVTLTIDDEQAIKAFDLLQELITKKLLVINEQIAIIDYNLTEHNTHKS